MEAFRHADTPWTLTEMYTDAKQSYNSAIPQLDACDAPDLLDLRRRSCIQKDRLVAWGLDWTDETNSSGNIDKSLERAGLTDIVSSVMENIKNVLDQIESISSPKSAAAAQWPAEKPAGRPLNPRQWTDTDRARYESLVTELTTSIDVLCDLSNSQRAEQRDEKHAYLPEKGPVAFSAQHPQARHEAIRQTRPVSYAKLSAIPKIDFASLIKYDESPPPYGVVDGSQPVRIPGYLQSQHPTPDPMAASWSIPVLIEYVNFDEIYRGTDLALPLDRMQSLYALLLSSEAGSTSSLPRIVGYSEDPRRARLGLLFDFPHSMPASYSVPAGFTSLPRPASLFDVLRSASQVHANPSTSASMITPPLETRFRLALELISGFDVLNKFSHPHRNINSSSIAFMPRSIPSDETHDVRYDFRKPVICGFDLFSEYNIESSPEYLHQNIYRHPDDPQVRGPNSSDSFRPEFDLYSLGLVLLEIGLWCPLADLYKEKYSLKDFNVRVEKIWTKKLAAKCGSAYMRVVQTCIAAGNQHSSHDLLRKTYDQVKIRLERCCMIDDEDFVLEDTWSPPSRAVSTPTVSMMMNFRAQPSQDVFKNLPVTPSPAPRKEIARKPIRQSRPSEPKRTRCWQYFNKKMSKDVREHCDSLAERLSKLATRVVPSSESMMIDVCYTGESEERAKPTVVITCSSTSRVRACIRKNVQYDADKVDVVVVKGRVTRSASYSRAKMTDRPSKLFSVQSNPSNPHYNEKPTCGASIGAWKDEEHLPAASLGGIVLVDDRPYGLSVHHFLDAPEETLDGVGADKMIRSSHQNLGSWEDIMNAAGPTPSFEFDVDYSDDEAENDDALSEDASDFDFGFEQDDIESAHSDVDDDTEPGDVAGFRVGVDDIRITQPALCDVPDVFFPVVENKDEDHLDSHGLGHIFASSGIRRSNVSGTVHEVDWALVEVTETRLLPGHNVVAAGADAQQDAYDGLRLPSPTRADRRQSRSDTKTKPIHPTVVADSTQIADRDVLCLGRTSGLIKGRISDAMAFVKFPGRQTMSKTWYVSGGFGMPGDSGGWVIETDGTVVGYCLGFNANRGLAMIAPMDVMLEDVRHTLGASSVRLPGKEQSHYYEDSRKFPGPSNDGTSRVAVATVGADDEAALVAATYQRQRAKIGPMPPPQGIAGSTSTLYSMHSLMSGNPSHIEKQWNSWRASLGGQTV